MRKSKHRLEKDFQTHSISEGSEFIRTKRGCEARRNYLFHFAAGKLTLGKHRER